MGLETSRDQDSSLENSKSENEKLKCEPMSGINPKNSCGVREISPTGGKRWMEGFMKQKSI